MNIPKFIEIAIKTIEQSGYEAYAVGGCVRDSLLGISPHDWDLTTSATPDEILRIFSNYKTIDIGSRYGTITVIIDGRSIEITTYRKENGYSDNRHPSNIIFTKNLADDLCRRDFTINAMAYSPSKGLVDLFDGADDLKKRIIRCVGDPENRFTEDALRIMRMLRFAAVLGFSVEPDTIAAAFLCRQLLGKISVERITCELNKILTANNPSHVLRLYRDIFAVIIPELSRLFDFDQNNPHHCFDAWEHTLSAISQSNPSLLIRLTLLFHDIAKPLCARRDQKGITHFKEHAQKGSEVALKIMKRLKYDNKTTQTVKLLIELHDSYPACNKISVKKLLNKIGIDNFRLLLEVQKADNLAKADGENPWLQQAYSLSNILETVISDGDCFSLAQLAISGNDLLETKRVEGKKIGHMLDFLLNAVIEEKCENQRSALFELFKNTF